MTCAGCGTQLERAYRSQIVEASERVMVTNPDGSGMVTTARALVACSWRCLAAASEPWVEPVPAGVRVEPF